MDQQCAQAQAQALPNNTEFIHRTKADHLGRFHCNLQTKNSNPITYTLGFAKETKLFCADTYMRTMLFQRLCIFLRCNTA